MTRNIHYKEYHFELNRTSHIFQRVKQDTIVTVFMVPFVIVIIPSSDITTALYSCRANSGACDMMSL